MNTTLYRSLALLVSIFALTSSFSLSSMQDGNNQYNGGNTPKAKMNNSKIIDPEKNEVGNLETTNTTTKSDLKANKNGQSSLSEMSTSTHKAISMNKPNVEIDPKHPNAKVLKNIIYTFVASEFKLKGENVYFFFKIYNKATEDLFVFIVFDFIENNENSEKLVLCKLKDKKELVLWDPKYAKMLKRRKVELDVLKKGSFSTRVLRLPDGYMFPIAWQHPYGGYTGLKVFTDGNGETQVNDFKAPQSDCGNTFFINVPDTFIFPKELDFKDKNKSKNEQSSSICKPNVETDKQPQKPRDQDFRDIRDTFLASEFGLEGKDVHSSFSMFRERTEDLFVGIVFNKIKKNKKYSEKLVLCKLKDGELVFWNTKYAKVIEERKVYTLKTGCFVYDSRRLKDGYMFPIVWKAPHRGYTGLKMFIDENGEMQVTDFKSPPPSKQSNQSNCRNAILGFFGSVVIVMLCMMYSKGWFSLHFRISFDG